MHSVRVGWHADQVAKLRSELTKDRGPWPVMGLPVRHPARVGPIALMIGVVIGMALPKSLPLTPILVSLSYVLVRFVIDLIRDLRHSRQP